MIHYHGTPIGGPSQDHIRFLHSRHALVSFAYKDDLGAVADACKSFIFDNGAFTAWKNGNSLDIDAYYNWVLDWHMHPGFDWFLVPDVIDGSETDNDNLLNEIPIQLSHVACPVYHLHESFDRLERLIYTYKRIALGSSGNFPTPGAKIWWERMCQVMNICCDDQGKPKVKLHGLRMLNPKIFTKLPLSSADSSNAARKVAMCQTKFGTYKPPKGWQRAAVVADRCEAHNSAPIWGGTGFSYENCIVDDDFEKVGLEKLFIDGI